MGRCLLIRIPPLLGGLFHCAYILYLMTSVTSQRLNYKEFKAKQKQICDIKSSAVRCTPMWLLHLTFPPIVSLAYCSKMGHWKPVIAASAVACLTIPLDIAGTAVLTAVFPPIVSAGMITSKVKKSREDLGIVMPEEADERMYNLRS